ncbi:hypothetical protein Tsubulata_041898 [Turnera subulata]|uniref:Uncharacterized protein n=1 Tax=Turnera subulata TaxID=218843 RepID=A0A9Q0JJ31_9ROSI|nr:hypothetical protein Tsubulata_041898 [Turnera subulata]
MDTKALAKSKRAHSLHHSKKPHPNQKSKTQSSSTAPAGIGDKKVKEKPRRPALPSNWDRYGEEFDAEEVALGDDNGVSSSNTKPPFDVVVPKSKGADFRHLIAEAQSQPQSHSYFDGFASLDDVLPGDFHHGFASMLSVRGEGIVSWIGDDNFVVEDDTGASQEASFLSLNLHALAEQLEKVDLSERLFIDAELLPPELGSQGSSDQALGQTQSSESETTATNPKELDLKNFPGKNEDANQSSSVSSLGSTSNCNSDSLLFSQTSDTLNQVKRDPKSSQDTKTSQTRAQAAPTLFTVSSDEGANNGLPTFKATAAEAELDMLLNSFSETKLVDSSGPLSVSAPISQKAAPIPLPQLTKNAPGSSKTPSTAAILDDVLDDLLEETSNLSKKNGLHQPRERKADSQDSQSSSSQSVTKSKVLDDFDSWLDTI